MTHWSHAAELHLNCIPRAPVSKAVKIERKCSGRWLPFVGTGENGDAVRAPCCFSKCRLRLAGRGCCRRRAWRPPDLLVTTHDTVVPETGLPGILDDDDALFVSAEPAVPVCELPDTSAIEAAAPALPVAEKSTVIRSSPRPEPGRSWSRPCCRASASMMRVQPRRSPPGMRTSSRRRRSPRRTSPSFRSPGCCSRRSRAPRTGT